MNLSTEEIILAIRQIYIEVLDGEASELYMGKEGELEDLYNHLQSCNLDSKFKPLLQELHLLNNDLISRISFEKEELTKDRKVYEKQKLAMEHYSNNSVQYDAYFIDKKR